MAGPLSHRKQVELLGELVPPASRIAAIWDPAFGANRSFLREAEAAAGRRGFTLQPLEVRWAGDVPGVFATMLKEHTAGVVVLQGPTLFLHRTQIIDLAAKRRLPTIFMWREGPEAGPLDPRARVCSISGAAPQRTPTELLRGEKPGELPVEQPTKFELVINMKTARARRLTIPPVIRATSGYGP